MFGGQEVGCGGGGGYIAYTRRWLILALFVTYSASNAFQVRGQGSGYLLWYHEDQSICF